MRRSRQASIALALDLLVVIVFVATGRRSHDEGSAFTESVKVAAPFAIGVVFGWLTSRAWRSPMEITTGVVIWAETIVLGMLLRKLVFDRGTAVSFVIVTTIFLGVCMLGWRGAARALSHRRQNSTATAGTS